MVYLSKMVDLSMAMLVITRWYQKSNCYVSPIFPSYFHHINPGFCDLGDLATSYTWLNPGYIQTWTYWATLLTITTSYWEQCRVFGWSHRGHASKCRWLGFTKHYRIPSYIYIYRYIDIYMGKFDHDRALRPSPVITGIMVFKKMNHPLLWPYFR